MNDQDIISEDERHEAATETPAFLGCPQHMPTHLPSGFDGVEPGDEDEPAPVRHFWRNVAIMLAILAVYFLVMAAISAESIEWMLKGGAL